MISALVLVHHSPDLGMTEIGLIQQYSSQQPMAESVIRVVTFTGIYLQNDIMYLQRERKKNEKKENYKSVTSLIMKLLFPILSTASLGHH